MARRCRQCKTLFKPMYSSLQVCCTPKCALEFAKTDKGKKHSDTAKAKDARKWLKNKRDDLKPLSTVYKEVQVDVNKYIRTRDKGQPCISCENPNPSEAGHYYAIGSKFQCNIFRFDERNIHLQCHTCNHHKSGAPREYREGLLQRYDESYLEAIEEAKYNAEQQQQKLTKAEVRQIGKKFRQMTRELEKNNNATD